MFFRRNCCCFCERANTHLFKTSKIIKNDWKLLMLRSFEVEVFCVLQIAIILPVNALHIAAYVYMWCCTCMYYNISALHVHFFRKVLTSNTPKIKSFQPFPIILDVLKRCVSALSVSNDLVVMSWAHELKKFPTKSLCVLKSFVFFV